MAPTEWNLGAPHEEPRCTGAGEGGLGPRADGRERQLRAVVAKVRHSCRDVGLQHSPSALVHLARELTEAVVQLGPAERGRVQAGASQAAAAALDLLSALPLQGCTEGHATGAKGTASTTSSGSAVGAEGQGADGTLCPCHLQACAALLAAAARSGPETLVVDGPTDVALACLRCFRHAVASPGVAVPAAEALRGLRDFLRAQALDSERLRRAVALCSEVLVLSCAGGADAQGAASEALIAAVVMSAGRHADNFQIMLDYIFGHAEVLAAAPGVGLPAFLASVLMRVLAATCALPPFNGSLERCMVQAFDGARHYARLVAVALLRCAVHGSIEVQVFVERLVANIAMSAMEPWLPAAPTLLRACLGSLTVILRSRGTGGAARALAVRILGRLAAGLAATVSAAEGEARCSVHSQARMACRLCEGGHSGQLALQSQQPQQQRPEREAGEEVCGLCALRSAAKELTPQAGTSDVVATARWSTCYLLLLTHEEAMRGHMLVTGLNPALVALLEPMHACGFSLCECAATLRGEPEGSGSGTGCLRRFLERGWEHLTERAAAGSHECQAAGKRRTSQHPGPWPDELLAEAAGARDRALRAVALQLRSPRARLRAAALRALGIAAKADGGAGAVRQFLPRRVLLPLLCQDASARVRQAALAHTGRLLLHPARAGLQSQPWVLGAIRTAAAGDSSPVVRTAASGLLGAFVRQCPADPRALEACCDLVGQLARPFGTGRGASTLEDLRFYCLGNSAEQRAPEVLQLLATARRFGARNFVPQLLRAHTKAIGAEESRADTARLASALVAAFIARPEAPRLAGLVVFSEAAPWSLEEHVQTIALCLAVDAAPSASEEVLALGACDVLAEVLSAVGAGATRALSRWTWARIDGLVASHGSRLVRPAMRCLCAAAMAEGDARPILRHLRPAVRLLQQEAAIPCGNPGLVRAAWIAGVACECCNLDHLLTLDDLQLNCCPGSEAVMGGVGEGVAHMLLEAFGALASASQRTALPALVLALGFALRRHKWLATSAKGREVLANGLTVAPGCELLAERTLEAFVGLVEELTGQAERGGPTLHSTVAPERSPHEATAQLAQLAQHQTAVLVLLRHGLCRRAEAADVPIRTRALAAVRALHHAGLGHPGSIALALLPPLFADQSLRRGAAALLRQLVGEHPQAVAATVGSGLREAFAAMLWQAPHQLSLGGAPGLARASIEAGCAFAAARRAGRARWLRALLAELQGLHRGDLISRMPGLPADLSGASRGRLAPFPSGRSNAPKPAARHIGDECGAEWSSEQRLVLLYGHFVATVLAALPLNSREVQLLTEECHRYLELYAAGAVSAFEHDVHSAVPDRTLAVCVSAALCCGLMCSLKAEAGGPRISTLRAALRPRLAALLVARGGGGSTLAEWLAGALGEDQPASRRQGGKRRRAPTLKADVDGIERTSSSRGSRLVMAHDPLTPPKRQLPRAYAELAARDPKKSQRTAASTP